MKLQVGSSVLFSTKNRKGFIAKQVVGTITKVKTSHLESALYKVKFSREITRYGKLVGSIWATYEELVLREKLEKLQ